MIRSTVLQPSHSRLSRLQFCRRAYFYSYHLGIEAKQEFPPAFAGSAGHEGLECWHRTGDMDAALAAFQAVWGTKRFHGDWDFLTAGHMECILRNYMESKHTQGWEVVRLRQSDLRSDRLIATDAKEDAQGFLILAEASFIVDVPGLGPVNVRPDLLLRVASGLRIADHKFKSGYLGSKVYHEAKYGHQLRLYALTMGALLDQPVTEGAVNAIYMGATASTDKFKGKRFEPYEFDYTSADFEETKAWYRSSCREAREMAEHFFDSDELSAPQNPGSHCGYCDFNKLCAVAPAYRPALIKLEYSKRKVA